MTNMDTSNKIRARFPVKLRALDATLQQLGAASVDALKDDDITWRARITLADFKRAFPDRISLLQSACRHLYQVTMERNARWALDKDQQWSVRERFEAYLQSLNLGDDAGFYNQIHHLITATKQIWPEQQATAFDHQYFKDCWIDPLYSLLKHIMRNDQAHTLALSIGNRLHEAAFESGSAIRRIIKELRYELPDMYEVAQSD